MASSRRSPPKVTRNRALIMAKDLVDLPEIDLRVRAGAIGASQYLPGRPRLADEIQQQADRHFHDVKQAVPQADAAAPRPTMAHAHREFADAISRTPQQKDHLRLRIIFRVP